MPLISIIIVARNSWPYIRRSLSSAIAQTLFDIEIIVVVSRDSADQTLDYCRDMARHDKRIKVIVQSGFGEANARNEGMLAANGQYFGFIDSDDFAEPEMFEKLVYPFLQDKTLILSVINYSSINERGKKVSYQSPLKNGSLTSDEYLRDLLIQQGGLTPVWSSLFRADLIQDLRFLEGKSFTDFIFLIQYLCQDGTVFFTPTPLYLYFINSGSLLHRSFSQKNYDCVLNLFDILEWFSVRKENLVKEYENTMGVNACELVLNRIPPKEIVSKNERYVSFASALRERESSFANNPYLKRQYKKEIRSFLRRPLFYSFYKYFVYVSKNVAKSFLCAVRLKKRG